MGATQRYRKSKESQFIIQQEQARFTAQWAAEEMRMQIFDQPGGQGARLVDLRQLSRLAAEGVLPAQTLVRTNKYLNNMIEQDHRKAPQRCYPMLGFKTFGNAEMTLSGIELANKIKKGQFDTSGITGPGAMIMQVWEAALAV